MADDDIIRGGLDIVTDKKKNKPKAEQETAQPTAARFNKVFVLNGFKYIFGWRDSSNQQYPLGHTLQGWLDVAILPVYNAPINVKSKEGGVRHRVGILTFSKKIIKFPTPGQKISVKISRNKWFSSPLLFEIDRSNA